MINKIHDDVMEMLDIVPDGASIAVGGFGLTGAPIMLCDALCELGKNDIHIVANNAGIEPSVGVFIDGVYRSRSAAQPRRSVASISPYGTRPSW